MNYGIYKRRMLTALAWVVLVLSACSGTMTPAIPKRPVIEPPKPSGGLLNPQLRVAISPDFPPLAQKGF
jgi:hypothetical protein